MQPAERPSALFQFSGRVWMQELLGKNPVVATAFCNSYKQYLSTDLIGREPVKPDFHSPELTLRGLRALARRQEFCPPGVRDLVTIAKLLQAVDDDGTRFCARETIRRSYS